MTLYQMRAWSYLNVVRLLGRTELYQPTFNPNGYFLFGSKKVQRESADRVDFMEESIDFGAVGSYLDVGSQLGYMVCRLGSKYKLVSVGLDHDTVAVRYARAVAELNLLSGVSFMEVGLNPETAEKLPGFDVISFLNVFHHIAWHQSFEAAEEVMKILLGKCDYLVFETGMVSEVTMPWVDSLGKMGSDTDVWVRKFLAKQKAKIVAEKKVRTHLGDELRTVYVVKA